jgi:hypothetical protein
MAIEVDYTCQNRVPWQKLSASQNDALTYKEQTTFTNHPINKIKWVQGQA